MILIEYFLGLCGYSCFAYGWNVSVVEILKTLVSYKDMSTTSTLAKSQLESLKNHLDSRNWDLSVGLNSQYYLTSDMRKKNYAFSFMYAYLYFFSSSVCRTKTDYDRYCSAFATNRLRDCFHDWSIRYGNKNKIYLTHNLFYRCFCFLLGIFWGEYV